MKCSTWVQSHKWQNDLGSFLRQNHSTPSNPSLCPNHRCQKSWSWMVLWRFTRPRTNTKKRCPFHHRELECKSRKSGDAWSKRQVWPWSTKWSRTKANRAFPREHTNRRKHSFNYSRDSSIHGHHQMVNTEIILTLFFATKDGEALYSWKKQHLELTVAQIMSFLLQNLGLNWRK